MIVTEPEFNVFDCSAAPPSPEIPQRAGGRARSHHLLKHPLPTWDVQNHFGTTEHKEISREISKMGQRDLQQKFKEVYGSQTFSNNNNWLRRKLMEAAGVQTPKAQGRGRPTAQRGSNKSSGSRPSALAAAGGVPGVPPPRGSPTSSRSSAEATKHRSPATTEGLRRTARKCKPSRLNKEMMADTGAVSVSSDDDFNPLEPRVGPSGVRSTNAISAFQLGAEHARAQALFGREATDALAAIARSNYARSMVPGNSYAWNNGFSSGTPFYSPMQWGPRDMELHAARTRAILQQHGRYPIAHESGESDVTIGGRYEPEGEPAVDHNAALMTRTSSYGSIASASDALLMDMPVCSRPNTALPMQMSADPRYGISFGMSSEPQTPVASYVPDMPSSPAESCSALEPDGEEMAALIRSLQPDNMSNAINLLNRRICAIDAQKEELSVYYSTDLFD